MSENNKPAPAPAPQTPSPNPPKKVASYNNDGVDGKSGTKK